MNILHQYISHSTFVNIIKVLYALRYILALLLLHSLSSPIADIDKVTEKQKKKLFQLK